jgi:aryl-alcohol dehydrogenase-like predicted oxidoreductase
MSGNSTPMSRREALRLSAGLGAGIAMGGIPLLSGCAEQEAPSPPGGAMDTPGAPPSGDPSGSASVDAVITKAIPSTGEQLPAVGIGTARRYDVGDSEEERAPLREVLRLLPDLGGTVVDTAPSYGAAETVLGDLMAELGNRDRIFLATKVRQQDHADALAEIERSYQRLRTDRFDLLKIHNLVGWEHKLPVLREMREEGRIRYLGISTSSEGQYGALAAIMEDEDLDFIQVDYAIDNREAEERILPLAQERGMGVFVNLPFGRGRVFQAFGDRPIPEWAQEHGIESWAQFALMFVISHPAVTVAAPGTATPEYARDNVGTLYGTLPDQTTRSRMAELVDAG